MSDRHDHVVAFYSRHPISAEHIIAKLETEHGGLADLGPETLFVHDQDHYGGLAANDALAERARLKPGMHVADFCAGLGGPARYLAAKYGVHVVGVELNPHRVAGANRLNQLVGMTDRVNMLQGDVTDVDMPDASVDAVISQEALLHVPDKAKALREAQRILRPGGRLVFSDWVVHRPLAPQDVESMWNGIAAQDLQSIPGYGERLRDARFSVEASEDLTAAWAVILAERFDMYKRLRHETKKAGKPSGDDSFYNSYARLVELVQAGDLGGGRFTALKG
ncbi:MAG: methyltransferase domain-containing protein [Rhodospirillales bacterium]